MTTKVFLLTLWFCNLYLMFKIKPSIYTGCKDNLGFVFIFNFFLFKYRWYTISYWFHVHNSVISKLHILLSAHHGKCRCFVFTLKWFFLKVEGGHMIWDWKIAYNCSLFSQFFYVWQIKIFKDFACLFLVSWFHIPHFSQPPAHPTHASSTIHSPHTQLSSPMNPQYHYFCDDYFRLQLHTYLFLPLQDETHQGKTSPKYQHLLYYRKLVTLVE